jgi:hypothetical protein
MKKRLLKFDIVHPAAYLERKKSEWGDLEQLSASEYRDRLISLRSNYSDFYTHYLNEFGWQAEEFFLLDETFLDKLGKELYGSKYLLEKTKSKTLHQIRPLRFGWAHRVVETYIKKFEPDVIFVRSQPFASRYWQQFRGDSLLVSRLSAKLPHHWHPQDWDLIYTDIESFKDFFEAHNVPTLINKQGFDPRILSELQSHKHTYDVTFVGGMGTQNFSRRTELFEHIAKHVDFKWWGYWWKHTKDSDLNDFPNLKRTFQGPTSGLEMYQIYKDSKIVMNDYVDIDITHDIGYNQRMFEVMGVGSFMLTRNAANLSTQFPPNLFETFDTPNECIDKVLFYLDNERERKEMGGRAQEFVLNNHHYRDIVNRFHIDLMKRLSP